MIPGVAGRTTGFRTKKAKPRTGMADSWKRTNPCARPRRSPMTKITANAAPKRAATTCRAVRIAVASTGARLTAGVELGRLLDIYRDRRTLRGGEAERAKVLPLGSGRRCA